MRQHGHLYEDSVGTPEEVASRCSSAICELNGILNGLYFDFVGIYVITDWNILEFEHLYILN